MILKDDFLHSPAVTVATATTTTTIIIITAAATSTASIPGTNTDVVAVGLAVVNFPEGSV